MRFWPQLRQFVVFQVKLYVDALRDFLLSFLALGAFVLDLLLQREGEDSFFETVLRLGRRTERAINLFNHFDPSEQPGPSVDKFFNEVEQKVGGRMKQ